MQKLLTIAIPTYNRAGKLDTQLSWLSRAVKGFEKDIEIFVSDNCSTDDTPEVINRWKSRFTDVTFNVCRNAENIGVLRNVMNCLQSATTKYVWAIGDDDPIQDRAIEYTINKLREYDDISLLFLNFSGRHYQTGEPAHPPTISGNRWFDIENEDGAKEGKAVFEHCMATSVGAVIFLSAIVYRADLVKEAVRAWPDCAENWMYMAYLDGYCAANGRLIVTRENYLECIVATSYWLKDPRAPLLMQYKHVPEVVQKLSENGYSTKFYRRMMMRSVKDASLRVLLGGLRRWPVSTTRTIARYAGFVGRGIIGV